LARRLDRPERGARNLRIRGAVVTLALAAAALALAWLVQWLTRHYPLAWGFEVALLALLLAQRSTWSQAAAVAAALQAGSLVRAREALRRLAGEGLGPDAVDGLGPSQVVEAAVAALGRRFARALLGPVFWYVLLGLPGLFLQQGAQVMAVGLGAGRGASRAGAFGMAARTLDRALTVLPDYLAGLILAAAAGFVPGGQPRLALGPALKGRAGGAGALSAALAALPASARLRPALGAFAVACLIDAGLIALLALARLGL
jgi:adenosylcobinamide-phosphate synthase